VATGSAQDLPIPERRDSFLFLLWADENNAPFEPGGSVNNGIF
jgi:hypothetical protein